MKKKSYSSNGQVDVVPSVLPGQNDGFTALNFCSSLTAINSVFSSIDL
jgi:hypothetical protein